MFNLLRLQSDGSLVLIIYSQLTSLPAYAVLSHVLEDGEVSFEDIVKHTGRQKKGYEKLILCATEAASDGLEYLWVGSCCVNRNDEHETEHTQNLTFHMLQRARKCYVYLSDVPIVGSTQRAQNDVAFRKSQWFTRAWTLQELITPSCVTFLSSEGWRLGDKKSFLPLLLDITRIPASAFDGTPLSDFSVDQRISWLGERTSSRKEDRAYSLMGILDVYISPCYGEGEESAFKRLREAIGEHSSKVLPRQVTVI